MKYKVKYLKNGGQSDKNFIRDPANKWTNDQVYNKVDPGGGYDIISLGFYNYDWTHRSGNVERKGRGYVSTPDSEHAFKLYLGKEKVGDYFKPANLRALKDDDASDEQKRIVKSTFIGTTPTIDKRVQAIADTTNTGKIVRNYDFYKKIEPNLVDKQTMTKVYNLGKKILNNPGKWIQANESYSVKPVSDGKDFSGASGFDMLQNFGLKWNSATNEMFLHDAYNFPKTFGELLLGEQTVKNIINKINLKKKILGINNGPFNISDPTTSISKYIPERRSEIKIRGVVSLPKNGSYLLRDNLKNYNAETFK